MMLTTNIRDQKFSGIANILPSQATEYNGKTELRDFLEQK